MKTILAISALTLLSHSAMADWSLNPGESDFSFSSIKKSSVLENHSFKTISGGVDDQGKATLNLDLSSVDTGIGIRDERMQQMLFETSKFATASFSAQVDTQQLEQLQPGQSVQQALTGMLNLHGMEKELTANVRISKLAANKLLVSTTSPVTVNAADFGLDGGVTALREVAKLPAISFAVPVNFNLVFDQ